MVKTWQIIVSYSFSKPGQMESYYVKGETLYDAFKNFYLMLGSKHLVTIIITEVKHNEQGEGIFGADQEA